MKISLNWLKDYVDINESPEELARSLTMHSVEVEEIKPQAELLDKVVVGKIKEIRKHSNADKLQLVDTETDEGIVQIVCGGTNLRKDMFVAIAKVGAKVRWHGEGEPVVLEKAKIRGEVSDGMICLDSEIGLGENIGTEIMDVEEFLKDQPEKLKKIKPGITLVDLLELDDYILDIDNKSLTHRSDLFCHIGIAREYAAIKNKKLKLPEFKEINENDKHKLNIKIQDNKDTLRYMAVVLDEVEIKPSPAWLQKKLRAVGIKVINNVVDITNFLMLETGHPTHAFDYDKISGGLFHLRRAKKGEKMITLDKEEQALNEEMLIIEDEKKITDLPGILGGEASEIETNTKRVVFEVADFNKVLIRKTANSLGLRTEAVIRNEKGLGFDLTEQALKRGVELFKKYAGAKVSSKIYDEHKLDLSLKKIELDLQYLNKLAGLSISKEKVVSILNSLQLKIEEVSDSLLKITVPLFRTDLNISEDLIEEVIRIYGYENIELKPLEGILEPVEALKDLKWRNFINSKLVSWGFNEVMNYSFYGDKELEKSLLKAEDHIQIANPLSEDQKYLRTTLLLGLLKNVNKNLGNKFHNLNLFETGHVYFKDIETKMFAGALTGPGEDVFFEAKGAIKTLLKELNVKYHFSEITKKEEHENHYWQMFKPDIDLVIKVKDEIIGTLNLVNNKVLSNFNIKNQEVAFFNFNLFKIAELATNDRQYKPISKYPEIDIDLSIILDEKYTWRKVKKEIQESNKLITKIRLFDIYKGEKIESGKKSLAMHLIFQSNERTLEMKEVENFRDEIMKKLNNKFKAIIRDK